MTNSTSDYQKGEKIALASAFLGALVWGVFFSSIPFGPADFSSIYSILLFHFLLLTPLFLKSLASYRSRFFQMALWFQPLAALLVVLSFFCHRGSLAAGGLSCAWLVLGILTACDSISHWWNRKEKVHPFHLAVDLGGLFLPLGGLWFFFVQVGYSPLNFSDRIVLLTSIHSHFTGVAGSWLLAFLLLAKEDKKALLASPLWVAGIGLGFALTAGGITLGQMWGMTVGVRILEGAGILIVFGTFLALAMGQLRGAWNSSRKKATRLGLGLSSLALLAGLLLALTYGWYRMGGKLYLDILAMVRYHGWTMALGFVTPALLAWMWENNTTFEA